MKSMQYPAVTEFISVSVKPGERAFLLKLHSGKTHQLRVALKSLSAAICGDKRYASSADANAEQRGYLHSYALRFELYGESFTFCHPPLEGQRFLSNEFKGVLAKWYKPWEFFKG